MRKFTFLAAMFCLLGLGNIVNAQIVNIPDADFKAALLNNASINTNGDGEIQTSEAMVYSGTIDVSFSSISDLTGIEAFTSLTKLHCTGNQLTSLNLVNNTTLTDLFCQNNQLTSLSLSTNIALTILYCYSNQLTSLNLSGATALNNLQCFYNQLTSLDLSNNTSLTILRCFNNKLTNLNLSTNTALTNLQCNVNQLTSLNLSANTALNYLRCSNNQLTDLNLTSNTTLTVLLCDTNQLTSLNLSAFTALIHLKCNINQLTSLDIKNGSNINLITFYANDNPNLTCIHVDDSTYMSNNWANAKDSTAYYSEDCTVGIPELINPTEIKTYPNPTSDKLAVSVSSGNIGTIEIYNLIGEKVYEKNFNQQKTTEINLSNSPCGIYFLKISDGTQVYTSKIVVQ